jgi:hypothetical protein
MREVPQLPPGYRYDRSGRRVYIRFDMNGIEKRLRAAANGQHQYWYNDQVAAGVAWEHYTSGRKSEYTYEGMARKTGE